MKSRSLLCLGLLAAASCGGDFPRDPEGTLDRVRSEGRFRVAFVSPTDRDRADPKVRAFLLAIAKASGATPKLETGDMEPMLKRLEEGEIDLLIGRFEKKSPWVQLVTIGPPLRREKQGKVEFHLAPVTRNGENGWIGLIERAARDAAPEAQ